MSQTHKIAGAVVVLFGMSLADMPYLSVKLVPEAQAFRGRGAAFVVGAAVGSAGSSSSQASAAAAQQQAAAAQQQTTAAQQQTAAAQQQAAAAAAGNPLPLGTVVSALPGGCTKKVVSGVEYHVCGNNFYRAAFQGSALVYVTAQP